MTWGTESERLDQLRHQAAHHREQGSASKNTLEWQSDYYRARSEEKFRPKAERALWKQLADEADTRLGRNAPPTEQLTIF